MQGKQAVVGAAGDLCCPPAFLDEGACAIFWPKSKRRPDRKLIPLPSFQAWS